MLGSSFPNESRMISSGRVIVTLTNEVGKILANLHQVQLQGMINFETGIRVAHVSTVCFGRAARWEGYHLPFVGCWMRDGSVDRARRGRGGGGLLALL